MLFGRTELTGAHTEAQGVEAFEGRCELSRTILSVTRLLSVSLSGAHLPVLRKVVYAGHLPSKTHDKARRSDAGESVRRVSEQF